jgi:FkbM family methyltransferase
MSVPYEAMVWLRQEEPEDLLVLRRLLLPGQTFVDCGANVGLWSLVAATAVRPSGKVFAFEPNPRTHQRLAQHIEHNGLGAIVTTFASCCGSDTGELSFRCEARHNVSHVASESASNTVFVPVTPLDAALGDHPVHGVKIDVEGHELPVLKGSESLLRRVRPWICVEFNTVLAGTERLGDWDVHRYLASRGYRCRPFIEATGAGELREDWRQSGYCNLFYWPDAA